jgi:hypothetical protein
MFKPNTTTGAPLADKDEARPTAPIARLGTHDPRSAPPSPPPPWANAGSVAYQPHRPTSLHASLVQRAEAPPPMSARQGETAAGTLPPTVAARNGSRRQYTVRLDLPMSRRVERLAKFTGRTYQDLLEAAVHKYLGCQPEQETLAPNR